MTTHSLLPNDAHIGFVHLQVSDLQRSRLFYQGLLGFGEISLEPPGNGSRGASAAFSATGSLPALLLLSENPGARPKPARSTGLYHVAIRYPDRTALARAYQHLAQNNWPFQGASDHRVSEALYLTDPDNLGLELYVDRPRQDWPVRNGKIEMGSEPLDLDGLLADASKDLSPWVAVDPLTDIGHVHLHVASLEQAEALYCSTLGFEVTQRNYPGALFVSAGGYHHHLGLNIWAGRGVPPPSTRCRRAALICSGNPRRR